MSKWVEPAHFTVMRLKWDFVGQCAKQGLHESDWKTSWIFPILDQNWIFGSLLSCCWLERYLACVFIMPCFDWLKEVWWGQSKSLVASLLQFSLGFDYCCQSMTQQANFFFFSEAPWVPWKDLNGVVNIAQKDPYAKSRFFFRFRDLIEFQFTSLRFHF